MNVHDSTRIAALLSEHGYVESKTPDAADVIFVNTCSVREKAWHKAVSEAGRMGAIKKNRPDIILILAGCVAEQEKERFFGPVPLIDIVVGPDHYGDLPDLIQKTLDNRKHTVLTGFDKGLPEDFLSSHPVIDQNRPSQFLTIMKGCSQRCTYCIVPSVRGPERDRDVDSILKDAESLVAAGAKELVLLGQKVNGYKKDGITFSRLLSMLNDIDGLERLRFTSPHPMHMSDALIEAFAALNTLCESLHLPVQAGSNDVLARMKRRYTREEYIDVARRLKQAVPGFQISTDLIVGFPGETEAQFEETLTLSETVRFSGAFSFKYSPRPGTVAATQMADDVPETEKSKRLDRLHQVIDRIEGEIKEEMVGQIHEILVEGPAKLPGQLTGRARNNQIINVNIPDSTILKKWIGKLIRVRIEKAMPHSLEGTIKEG